MVEDHPTGTVTAHGDLDKTSREMYPLWVRNLTLTAARVAHLERLEVQPH